MYPKGDKKKEEKKQTKPLEITETEVELNEEELENIAGGIAPILGGNPNP